MEGPIAGAEGWSRYLDNDGDAYYHHAASGETQWTMPPDVALVLQQESAASTAASTAANDIVSSEQHKASVLAAGASTPGGVQGADSGGGAAAGGLSAEGTSQLGATAPGPVRTASGVCGVVRSSSHSTLARTASWTEELVGVRPSDLENCIADMSLGELQATLSIQGLAEEEDQLDRDSEGANMQSSAPASSSACDADASPLPPLAGCAAEQKLEAMRARLKATLSKHFCEALLPTLSEAAPGESGEEDEDEEEDA